MRQKNDNADNQAVTEESGKKRTNQPTAILHAVSPPERLLHADIFSLVSSRSEWHLCFKRFYRRSVCPFVYLFIYLLDLILFFG